MQSASRLYEETQTWSGLSEPIDKGHVCSSAGFDTRAPLLVIC
jgi:hypothetical protein